MHVSRPTHIHTQAGRGTDAAEAAAHAQRVVHSSQGHSGASAARVALVSAQALQASGQPAAQLALESHAVQLLLR